MVCANIARAQQPSSVPERQISRFTAGGHIDFAQPKEDFSENVNHGWGGGAYVLYDLDRRGILSLRLDFNYAAYGRETKRVPLSNTVGGRILVDVVTTNSLFAFGLGAQLSVPVGLMRPYATVGFSGLMLSTGTSVSGSDSDDEPFASTNNYEDGTGAPVLGSGLLFPVSRFVAIDLGARYHRGGNASYLREGSIIDNPDGTITINALESRTPFMLWFVGVNVRIWGRGASRCPRAVCWQE